MTNISCLPQIGLCTFPAAARSVFSTIFQMPSNKTTVYQYKRYCHLISFIKKKSSNISYKLHIPPSPNASKLFCFYLKMLLYKHPLSTQNVAMYLYLPCYRCIFLFYIAFFQLSDSLPLTCVMNSALECSVMQSSPLACNWPQQSTPCLCQTSVNNTQQRRKYFNRSLPATLLVSLSVSGQSYFLVKTAIIIITIFFFFPGKTSDAFHSCTHSLQLNKFTFVFELV